MKRILLIVILLISLKSYSSQITIGLNTKNIVAWNIWEYQDGELKQYLFLYNKDIEGMNIEIKLKRFEVVDYNFKLIKTDLTFHKIVLKPDELIKLAYPQKTTDLDFMEFFENQKSVGLMAINSVQPKKSFVRKKYRYYSNEYVNSGRLMFWIRLESIFDQNTKISFEAILRRKDDFQLIKILNNENNFRSLNKNLTDLKSSDKSIIALSKKNKRANVELVKKQKNDSIIIITIFSNYVELGNLTSSRYGKIVIFSGKSA